MIKTNQTRLMFDDLHVPHARAKLWLNISCNSYFLGREMALLEQQSDSWEPLFSNQTFNPQAPLLNESNS